MKVKATYDIGFNTGIFGISVSPKYQDINNGTIWNRPYWSSSENSVELLLNYKLCLLLIQNMSNLVFVV